MSAAQHFHLLSVQNYLDSELASPVKHEYLGGYVHAMAGARIVHKVIGGNIFATLHTRLRGKKCQPYNSDNKVRIQLPAQIRFYYPDTSVVCESNLPTDSFQDKPVVIVEVLSKATRRIDTAEKKDAYLTIPSLGVYVLVEQDFAAAIVYRRTDKDWDREVYEGLDAVIPLDEIETDLPLAEVYRGVEFSPELADGE